MLANLCMHPTNSAKMAAVLSMYLVLKTIVSSYRSNNMHLKYSKWKEKALKNTQKLLWWKKKSFMQ